MRLAVTSIASKIALHVDFFTASATANRAVVECTTAALHDYLAQQITASNLDHVAESLKHYCQAKTAFALIPTELNPLSGIFSPSDITLFGSALKNLEPEVLKTLNDKFVLATGISFSCGAYNPFCTAVGITDSMKIPFTDGVEIDTTTLQVALAVATVVAQGGAYGFNRQEYLNVALLMADKPLMTVAVSTTLTSLYSETGKSVVPWLLEATNAGYTELFAKLGEALIVDHKITTYALVNAVIDTVLTIAAYVLCDGVGGPVCAFVFTTVADFVMTKIYHGQTFKRGQFGSPSAFYALVLKVSVIHGDTLPCAAIASNDPDLLSPYDPTGLCQMRSTERICLLNNAGYVYAAQAGMKAEFYISTDDNNMVGSDSSTFFFLNSGHNHALCTNSSCVVISHGIHNYINAGTGNSTVQARSGGVSIVGGGPAANSTIIIQENASIPEVNVVRMAGGINHVLVSESDDPLFAIISATGSIRVGIANGTFNGDLNAGAVEFRGGLGTKDVALNGSTIVFSSLGGAEIVRLVSTGSSIAHLGPGNEKYVECSGNGSCEVFSAGTGACGFKAFQGPAVFVSLNAAENVFMLGDAADTAVGSPFKNTFHCSRNNDDFVGGAGLQVLYCNDGDGNDILRGASSCNVQILISTVHNTPFSVSDVGSDTVVTYGNGDSVTVLGCPSSSILVQSTTSQSTISPDNTSRATQYLAVAATMTQTFAAVHCYSASFPPQTPPVFDLSPSVRKCNMILNPIVMDCFKKGRVTHTTWGAYTICVPRQPATIVGTVFDDCIFGNNWAETAYGRGACDSFSMSGGSDTVHVPATNPCPSGRTMDVNMGDGDNVFVAELVNANLYVSMGDGEGSNTATIADGTGNVMLVGSSTGQAVIKLGGQCNVFVQLFDTTSYITGTSASLTLVSTFSTKPTTIQMIVQSCSLQLGDGGSNVNVWANLPSTILLGNGGNVLLISGVGPFHVHSNGPLAVTIAAGYGHNYEICGSSGDDHFKLEGLNNHRAFFLLLLFTLFT